jgi:hypothetical protein
MPGKSHMAGKKSGFEMRCSFFFSETGMALITTLLVLTLMTLSGFALLYFSTMDIRVSGNDRVSRTLLHRMEAVNLHVVQDLWTRDSDDMIKGSPSRPAWMYAEAWAAPMVRENFADALHAGKTFNALVDQDVVGFVRNWPSSGSYGIFSLVDPLAFPFIGNGRGRALVVDRGPSNIGSQDISGPVLYEYIVFSEYQDERGSSRILETSLLRKH